MKIEFSQSEIRHMQGNPTVLRALADYHDWNEMHADSVGADGSVDAERAKTLRAEAERIEKEW